ncbi:4890_t:CDS:2 [Ambispora leptoticha]|uniref:4890_t:CDS:1 n=1 Tax=Ambispora leptoticha TaxID=144679 RepID=A0A9N9BWL4_9GLOM|nr:4890_t:CDS:2 [Ambispora leptoticha]
MGQKKPGEIPNDDDEILKDDENSEKISNNTHVNEKTSISVQVDEDLPILLKLPTNMKLNHIRTMLEEEPEIKMNCDMYFMNETSRVLRGHESGFRLFEILIGENGLKIQKNYWAKIKENCKIEYGINFTPTGPLNGKKRVVEISNHSMTPTKTGYDQIIKCEKEEENFYVKNYLAESCFKTPLPGLKIGLSAQSKSQENITEFTVYHRMKRAKEIVTLNDIKPTKEFTDAVDKALESKERESLVNVAKDYGLFFCKSFEVGGIILSIKQDKEINTNITEFKEINAQFDLTANSQIRMEGSRETSQTNSLNDGYEFFQMLGGIEESYREEGIRGWLNSLKNCKNWRIIEYLDICSIFHLLDKDRQTRIFTENKIRFSRVINFDAIFDLADRRPCIKTIPEDIKLSDTDQMYLTIMKAEKQRGDFVARLHYINENSQPIILVQQLGKLKNKANLKCFSFKLGCTVVSKSLSSLFEQDSEKLTLESSETQLITTKNRCSAVIKNKARDPNTGLIATCVTRSKNIQSDPRDSEFIMGSYFNIKNSAIEACMFCYDKQMNLYNQFDSLPYKLSLNNW